MTTGPSGTVGGKLARVHADAANEWCVLCGVDGRLLGGWSAGAGPTVYFSPDPPWTLATAELVRPERRLSRDRRRRV